ncbi:amidase [Poseidonocella sp. HB161398]|uniref:amidase n=1 Tax=Poseidonocella sp. HB161398 TaxID=2320855 RepID=UPI0011099763|nr:amidase [Poseidonocella sp. HB161398]
MTAPLPAGLPGIPAVLDALRPGRSRITAPALMRIAALNPSLGAFLTVSKGPARAANDARRRAGRTLGPFDGVPVVLKDNIDMVGFVTIAQSRQTPDRPTGRDTDLVARLRQAGAVIIGRTALHEFVRGGSGDDLPWPDARNPWNAVRTCGGSGSGSAVAGMVSLAAGSVTGRSVRYPAECRNLAGPKPTCGCIGRRGIFPPSFSLDAAGPIARAALDADPALSVLPGHDPGGPGALEHAGPDPLASLEDGGQLLGIHYAHGYGAASGASAEQAATAVPPEPDRMDAATWTILLAGALAAHRPTLPAQARDYCCLTRKRLSAGTFVTGEKRVQAMCLRRLNAKSTAGSIDTDAAVVRPAAVGVPVSVAVLDRCPCRRAHALTAPSNLTGQPALAVPEGVSAKGLPLQLAGRAGGEATPLRIARAHERITGWHDARPDLTDLEPT